MSIEKLIKILSKHDLKKRVLYSEMQMANDGGGHTDVWGNDIELTEEEIRENEAGQLVIGKEYY